MSVVDLTCETCMKSYEFEPDTVPDQAIGGFCNWCPACEDKAEDYYEEKWYRANGSLIGW